MISSSNGGNPPHEESIRRGQQAAPADGEVLSDSVKRSASTNRRKNSQYKGSSGTGSGSESVENSGNSVSGDAKGLSKGHRGNPGENSDTGSVGKTGDNLEATGKKRRRRRPGNRHPYNRIGSGPHKDQGEPSQARQDREGGPARPHDQARPHDAAGGGAILPADQNGQPKKKRRRKNNYRQNNHKQNNRGQNHNASQSGETLRNLRAPAKTVEDVTYHPEKLKEGSERKRHANRRGRSANPSGQPGLYAALDLGTNNCRLLVAVPQEFGRFRVVDAFSRIVRLGEGLANTGRLSQDAMDRSVEALKICANKLRNTNIKRFRLIATEACRRAENGEAFLARVLAETGLKLEIVNRETEARLAAEGCGTLMDNKADGAVLFDIGGGSSELILIDRNQRGERGARSGRTRITDRIAGWTSLPLGVVTLAEGHGGKVVSRQVFDNMVSEVQEHIDRFEGRNQLDDFWGRGRVHLLGTSGTVTTLAGVHLKLPKYDRRRVDGVWLRSNEVDQVINALIDMNYEQRASNPCIGRDRADLVLAGCAVLQAIRQTWPCERLRVADRGLREGILNEMISSDGAWLSNRKRRWYNKKRGDSNRGGNAQNRGKTD